MHVVLGEGAQPEFLGMSLNLSGFSMPFCRMRGDISGPCCVAAVGPAGGSGLLWAPSHEGSWGTCTGRSDTWESGATWWSERVSLPSGAHSRHSGHPAFCSQPL